MWKADEVFFIRFAVRDYIDWIYLANDVVTSTVKEVGKQFQQAFMVENTKKEVFAKVGALENRVNGKFWQKI